jgi:hypothetical protein
MRSGLRVCVCVCARARAWHCGADMLLRSYQGQHNFEVLLVELSRKYADQGLSFRLARQVRPDSVCDVLHNALDMRQRAMD